ncbi:LLM class F420-dependent oxidoreductase [Phaeacidiphilus oryzae]|uniref:LLM class F420-dependent oxidoreductase n=1 Tax=Phaeacidiphilus oryzae TaxID=348818 RepID=UPI00056970E9|nr:LLM class F420-dependent oxidoreductase [Phaeacidiphilus oryzae]
MTGYGYFLSCEEFTPEELLTQARLAEQAGFHYLAISDHYHPWNEAQGSSPFVWSMIGALSQATSLPVTTFVTCPTVRIHPAVLAQATATSAVLTEGRFRFGVGSGEALNEHILGDRWPTAPERLEMLEEALQIIRRLWTGEEYSHRGKHYTVENARLYTVPEEPPPILVSGFGPQAAELAGRLGDGFVTMGPDTELIERFHKSGGAGRPVVGGLKVCWGRDRGEALRTAHQRWATEQLPGELNQVLSVPRHFEQAATLVTEEMTAEQVVCGPDPEDHVAALRAYADAGFDEVYVGQIGPDQQGFFDCYRTEVLPRLREPAGA